MIDIFISYSSKDKLWVQEFAGLLSSLGYKVWWDTGLIPGDDFQRTIPDKLDKAKCVIVVWTENSAHSIWVRAEANRALKRNVLVPILLRGEEIPLPFDLLHTSDFREWQWDVEAGAFQQFSQAVNQLIASKQDAVQSAGSALLNPAAEQNGEKRYSAGSVLGIKPGNFGRNLSVKYWVATVVVLVLALLYTLTSIGLPLRSAELNATLMENGNLLLTGTLNNQQELDEIVSAAGFRVDANKVTNQITVDDAYKTAEWLGNAKKLLFSLPTSQSAMSISDAKATLSGTEATKADYINTIRKARWSMASKPLMVFENNVKLDEPESSSGEVAARMTEDGKIILTGTLNSQQEVEGIVSAATYHVDADKLTNQLRVDEEYKSAGWLSSARKLLLSLPTFKGAMSINDNKAIFSGIEGTREKYLDTIRKARWSMEGLPSMAFENNVTLDIGYVE